MSVFSLLASISRTIILNLAIVAQVRRSDTMIHNKNFVFRTNAKTNLGENEHTAKLHETDREENGTHIPQRQPAVY